MCAHEFESEFCKRTAGMLGTLSIKPLCGGSYSTAGLDWKVEELPYLCFDNEREQLYG